jgi:excisionase family DNA binding protein
MANDYLTTNEVAELIGCSAVHVTRLVKNGRFPGTRKFDVTRKNSALKIPRVAVEAFIASQVISPDIELEQAKE